MRRAIWIAAAVATFGVALLWKCRHADAKRTPLGGYRCPDCGAAFADMEEAGLIDDVQVREQRRFERDPEAFIRAAGW